MNAKDAIMRGRNDRTERRSRCPSGVVVLALSLGACSASRLPINGADAGPSIDLSMPVGESFQDMGPAGGGDAFVPEPCSTATPIAPGPLCGSISACAVGINEPVPGTFSTSLNDSPAIAIDASGAPTIVVPTGTAPLLAAIVWRDSSGTWSRASVPSGAVTASLIRSGDALYSATEDYQTGATTWSEWKGGAWQTTETVWAHGPPYNHGTAADDSGCFFLAALDENTNVRLGRRSGGTWTTGVAFPSGQEALQPHIALSPGGRLHMALNLGYPTMTTGPSWVAPPLPPETLPSTTAINTLRGERLQIGVTDDGTLGRAHILFTSFDTLRYATRPAAGGWSDILIAANQLQPCPNPTPNATCTSDNVYFIPATVLTSGSGDVRLLYLRDEVIAESMAQCTSPTKCIWAVSSSSESAQLMLGLPSGTGVTSTSLASLPGGYFGDAVVDSTGTIHATIIDRAGNLRYLTLGP
jgi:hypothetical protein